jgi:hypothetical protein
MKDWLQVSNKIRAIYRAKTGMKDEGSVTLESIPNRIRTKMKSTNHPENKP